MKVILTNLGSVGDIQPLLALAAEMRAHGHRPVLALPRFYAARATELGFELVPLGPELDLQAIDRQDVRELIAGADSRPILERSLAVLESMLPGMFEELLSACRDAEVLVSGALQPAARMVHELAQVPFVSVQLNHFGTRRESGEREATARVINAFRARHGLAPLVDPLGNDANSPQLALYAFSRHLGLPTSSWPAHHQVTGFFFLDEAQWRPDTALAEFMAAGEPPIVVSFSSLACPEPERLTGLLAAAAGRAGCRAVLQQGWSGIGAGSVPSHVHVTGVVPHSWLFPRAALVVHHGGAQTSAAVLHAGVPAVIVPFVRDQPIWAELFWKMGVAAPPLPHTALSAESLGRALCEALADQALRRRAAAVGEQVRAEPGARRARQLIERLVDRVGFSALSSTPAARQGASRLPRTGGGEPVTAPAGAAFQPAHGAAPARPHPAEPRRSAASAGAALSTLLLSFEYGPEISGGMGTYVLELAQGLARAGNPTTVVACTLAAARVERRELLEVHLLSLGRRGTAEARDPTAGLLALNEPLYAAAKGLVERGDARPDLIACANWISFPASRRLAERLGVPVAASVQYLSEPLERWWGQQPDPAMVEQERRLCSQADLLLPPSHSMRTLLIESRGAPPERIRVVHDGVDAASFLAAPLAPEPRAAARQRLLAGGDRLVIFAGRINPMKGVAALIDAAARVAAARPGVRYLLVGGSDHRSYGIEMQARAASHPALAGRLTFLGKVPRRQLAVLYQLADLAVVPSIYEPFGYAAIEAMAAGLPVVATRAGGLAETVADGETGLLVPVSSTRGDLREIDVERLAEAQLAILSDPALAARFGAAGRRRQQQEFTLERMVEATVAAFRCIASPSTSHAAAADPAALVAACEGP